MSEGVFYVSQKVWLKRHEKMKMGFLWWEWSSVFFRKLITFLCSHLSPERRFSAGTQRCGGGCRRACGAGVCASTWASGAHCVLETQQCANQQQGRTHRREFKWETKTPKSHIIVLKHCLFCIKENFPFSLYLLLAPSGQKESIYTNFLPFIPRTVSIERKP